MEEHYWHIFKGRITKIEKHAMQDNVLVQGIKQVDQGYFDRSNRYAGSNGTYLEFGEYHGMALDVNISLYDTDKQFIEINNENYRIQRHIRVDIYNQLMSIWGLQRMSSQKYDAVRQHEGEKGCFTFQVMEDSMQLLGDDTFAVNIRCLVPFLVEDQIILSTRNIVVEKVK